MERYFAKYKRFLGAFFLLWLFLWTAGKFGFSFGVELFLLFRLVFFLGVIWVMGEIWVNWDKIYPIIKVFWAKKKKEFSAKTKTTQAEIISLSPKVLGNKAGSFIVLPLAVVFGVFREFRGFVKSFFQILFSKEGILFLGVLGILGDIFVLNFSSDLVILFLTGLWVWSVRRYQFEGRISIGGGLVFLIMCPLLLISKENPIAEKAAIWAYMFLLIGTIQLFIKEFKNNEN